MAAAKNRLKPVKRAFLFFASLAMTGLGSASTTLPYPSLRVVQRAVLTTAADDFDGHAGSFEAAAKWNEKRLAGSSNDVRAPHVACTGYGRGREAFSRLQGLLSPTSMRPLSHSSENGSCFLATASHAEVDTISAAHGRFGLESLAPFPSVLKLAPGLLEHQLGSPSGQLGASHGILMRMGSVEGLSVELSPGTLPAHCSEAGSFLEDILQGLVSKSLDLHSSNFWSDPSLLEGDHLSTPGGAVRGNDWSLAATLVHELSKSGNTSPADICSWDSISVHHAADDVLTVTGLDHLLYSGRGAGGHKDEATELHVACFMGLVSFLASRQEILRVSPMHSVRMLDAAARSIIQSATSTQTPLTAAGLDGTGEVIQIIDTGLDETSCFFADGDGQEVTHGHYFEELSESYYSTVEGNLLPYNDFQDGDFTFDLSRRKIIQYIDMINKDSLSSSSYITSQGGTVPWIPADGFDEDENAGHGTHTAGTAAGATLNSPAETATCDAGETLSCVGACIDATDLTDDLLTSVEQKNYFDIDRQCPLFACDDDSGVCLGDDVGTTLTENGGMAQGAKLAIFDIASGDSFLASNAGNGLWEPCLEAGCKIHSNSWGGDGNCIPGALDVVYDDFMYSNPENLLIFAAGNDGQNQFDTSCTINFPATAKNVLSVGATSAGETRLNDDGIYDIDHVASLSSWGFTADGRIKPEVVAPGDAVRQYFVDTSFYAADVTTRGFCGDGFRCEGFSPSSATVKALLINSANLMGDVSEPDGFRGFGRIHLEMGMPLNGDGSLALFVADASDTCISDSSEQEYAFDVDGDAGLDFRATLSWIDPPATSISVTQLVHDLDLTVVSPSGTTHTMWSSGEKDNLNVNERVVVDASEVESGTWTVYVLSNSLTTSDVQRYSLVVNGAIGPGPEGVSSADATCASSDSHSAASTAPWLSIALGAAASMVAACAA